MAIVVDTSVVLAVAANEATKPQLVELTRGHELMAPASVHWEVGNALSAMLKRRRMSVQQAVEILDAYLQIPLRVVDVPLHDTVRLAADLGIYAYDAYVIAAARKSGQAMLSLDGP